MSFFSYLKNNKLPNKEILKRVLSKPLNWDSVILYSLLVSIVILVYLLIMQINNKFLYTIPSYGGRVVEGMIGVPKYINPILSKSDTDVALTELIYSGLLQIKEDGNIGTSLAQAFEESDDKLSYTFILKKDLKWSDGKKITSKDVVFTLSKLANPALNDDYLYWQDISVDAIDDDKVVITLAGPKEDFLEKMTIGILPEHIWSNIADESWAKNEYNLKAIGSGPFKIKKMTVRNSDISEILLKRNKHFSDKKSYIDHYEINIYSNQSELLNAINKGIIDFTSMANTKTASQITNENFYIHEFSTDVTVGMYKLNNEKSLSDQQFLDIIDKVIDKEKIIDKVEHGYGMKLSIPAQLSDSVLNIEEGLASLEKIGYVYNNGILKKSGSPMKFKVAVENDPTTFAAAQELTTELNEIGVTIELYAFDRGVFRENVKRNNFSIFFASSKESDIPVNYKPVLLLYTKTFPFIIKNSVHISSPVFSGSTINWHVGSPYWFVNTDKVWKFFLKNQNIKN